MLLIREFTEGHQRHWHSLPIDSLHVKFAYCPEDSRINHPATDGLIHFLAFLISIRISLLLCYSTTVTSSTLKNSPNPLRMDQRQASSPHNFPLLPSSSSDDRLSVCFPKLCPSSGHFGQLHFRSLSVGQVTSFSTPPGAPYRSCPLIKPSTTCSPPSDRPARRFIQFTFCRPFIHSLT